MTGQPVVLQDVDRPELRSLLTATLDNGDLVLTGHDVGPAVDTPYGRGEHRYRFTVSVEDVPVLAEALHRELHDGHRGSEELLDLLRSAFLSGRFSSVFDLHHWMEGIPVAGELHSV